MSNTKRHDEKKDGVLGVRPAPGSKTTRVDTSSDGVASQPNSGIRPQAGKDSANNCDSLGNPDRFDRKAPGDAVERPVEKLHESKRRQFSNGNTN